MKKDKKFKKENWEGEEISKGKKLGYGAYNDMQDKKPKIKIKKKPKYKNNWLDYNEDDE
jgi:hypothetical protein